MYGDCRLGKWDSLPKPILPNSAKCPYLAHFADFFSAKWASEFGKVGFGKTGFGEKGINRVWID